MEMPIQFFSHLNDDINNAKTKRTLNLLRKRGQKYITDVNSHPLIDKKIKGFAKREYTKSLKLISKRKKHVI